MGVKGGGMLLSKIPKAGGILSSGFKLGAYGTGIFLTGGYALTKGAEVYYTKDYGKKGEIFGGAVTELALLGAGYARGARGATQIRGWFATRGRTELPLERITQKEIIEGSRIFPTAKPSTHLSLFKKTTFKIPELTEGTPGGFHATGEKFWKNEIKPSAGTSEFPGLYVSPEASIHFTRVAGSPYTFQFPTIKSILTGDKPALAFLKPKGFREVGYKKVSPYKIDDQTFTFDFKKLAKGGFIDIPKMKTEIEGVARVGAGAYSFESGKYFTTINKIRVPIDVFKAEGKGTKGIKTSDIFKTEEYYYPGKQSLIDPTGSLSKVFKGSSYVSKPSSYISGISSYVSKPSSKLSSIISRPSSLLKSTSKRSSKSYKSSQLTSFLSYPSKPGYPTIYYPGISTPKQPPYFPPFKFKLPKPKQTKWDIFKGVKQRKFYVSSIVGILSGKSILEAPRTRTSGLGFRAPVGKKKKGVKPMAKKKGRKKKR